ncbi:hypothetical protein ACJJIU_14310 [Microbulbifer sp. CnH-101-E]
MALQPISMLVLAFSAMFIVANGSTWLIGALVVQALELASVARAQF